MSRSEGEKIQERTERYSLVMEEAGRQAWARWVAGGAVGCALMTASDVFRAVCVVHPESFTLLLGRRIAVPETCETPAEGAECRSAVRCSSEVDRYLSPYGGVVGKMLESAGVGETAVDSLHIAGAFLWDPLPEVVEMLSVRGMSPEKAKASVAEALKREAAYSAREKRKADRQKTFEVVSRIREYLLARCFGQDRAVDVIVNQLSVSWTMPSREGKPLSLFFVGASGTGKKHLTETLRDALEEVLGIPKLPVVDFARFSTEQLPIDLIGRDAGWRDGGKKGILTSMAEINPRGVIVIENYEQAHPSAVSYLDTVLETGLLEDGYTKKNISFGRNIFVVITHKKEFAESDDFFSLSSNGGETVPRDKIIEGLVRFGPNFHSTLRLVDAIVMFERHSAVSFLSVLRDKISRLELRFRETHNADCSFASEGLCRILTEMHPNVHSAHPVISAVEASVLMPLQDWILHHYSEFSRCRRIRIEYEPLPDFEGAPAREDYGSFEDWMAARTVKRVLQAKRLAFKTKVEKTRDAVVLKFYDFSYVVLPAIEDSGYFSVIAPDVSFDDLIGVDVVRERISEVLNYLNGRKRDGVRPDTGIILCGEPGTGKTSVAKAIAHEMGVPFINVTGSDFMKGAVGAGVETVKKIFAAARRYSAVLFVDEIDGIGSRDTSSDECVRVINALLSELDGFRERNCLVIGGTNRYEALDEALTRPGRLSLKIQLGLLHRADERRRLIERTLAKANAVVDGEIVEQLVETTTAWSPANLIAMVNGGLRCARREGHASPEFAHFLKARTVVLLGVETNAPEKDGETVRLTAVHEAGHAVTAVLRDVRFVQATVDGVGPVGGFVERLAQYGFNSKDGLMRRIDMSLGGRVAEEILAEPTDGSEVDFEHATSLAARIVRLGLLEGCFMSVSGESEKEFSLRHRKKIEEILRSRVSYVRKLLSENRAFLAAVADALEVQKTLLEADVLSIRAERGKLA